LLPKLKGEMSIRDYITLNSNGLRIRKSHLWYHPTNRIDKKCVMDWARLPPKTSYLDDIMKVEKKKIGPQQYAPHKEWSSILNSITVHG